MGNVRRAVVLGWDVSSPAMIAVLLPDRRNGAVLEWWLNRDAATTGVDRPVGDWMWPCSRGGVPHVAIRPVLRDEPILIREDLLGRFLARVEWFAPRGDVSFEAEVAALLGGGS